MKYPALHPAPTPAPPKAKKKKRRRLSAPPGFTLSKINRRDGLLAGVSGIA